MQSERYGGPMNWREKVRAVLRALNYSVTAQVVGAEFEDRTREADRGLIIVSGAVLLTLLGLLTATWEDIRSPLGHLRFVILHALGNFGVSFILAFSASWVRIAGHRTPAFALIWVLCTIGSALMLLYSGQDFLGRLVDATEREVNHAEQRIDARLDALEKAVGLSAHGGGPR